MRTITITIAALALLGCASDTLPTRAERFAGYRITLDAAKNLSPGEARDNRIALYAALVEECKRAGL